MAVQDVTPIYVETATGAVKFNFKFKVLAVSDLQVLIDGVLQNSGYSVTLNGDSGGSVTFTTAPANGAAVMIRRDTPFTRAIDYQNNGDLLAKTINADFDRLWLALQEERAASDTTMNKPIGATAWQAEGFQIEGLKPGAADTDAATVGQVKTLNGDTQAAKTQAVNAATAANAAKTAAAASATAALQSEGNANLSKESAAHSESAASTSAKAADASAKAAKISETNAKASETKVATDAKSANDAATAAAGSQNTASGAATTATNAAGRAEQFATASSQSASTATTQGNIATTQAQVAGTHATNAEGSKEAAAKSATAATSAAEDSAKSAAAAKVSEQHAKTSETNAKTSETAVAADKAIIDGYIEALKNAGSWIFRGELPAGKNINTLQPTDANAGIWQQSTPAQATTANGYPVNSQPGILELFAHGMYGGAMRYTTSDGRVFLKHLSAAWNGTDGPWSSWYETGQARLNSYGIGIGAQVAKTSFDWQQYNFNVGEHILVSSNVWTNPPNGLPTMPGTSVCHLHILGAAGQAILFELTTNNITDSAFVKYSIRMSGAKGSRTCKARKIFTDAAPIPLDEGGTGGSYASKAALLQGLMDGFPLPLAKDGSAPNDAVTMRQLAQVSGTAGSGATMNGVMNNFIGAVEWFNGSRLKLPAGYVPADGQLLKRTDYPDLWAAINAGMFVKVTDAQWLNGPGGSIPKGQNRGKYSIGDGSTTFRMPDLNGGYDDDSQRALFLRGDANGKSTLAIGGVGEVLQNAAPEIWGNVSSAADQGYAGLLHLPHGSFADADAGSKASTLPSSALSGQVMADRLHTVDFAASRSSAAYGRHDANGLNPSSEVRPNSVTGIWIIRASGNFTAANTEFDVIAGDATAPTNGSTIHGGQLRSLYQVAGKTRVSAGSYANYAWGDPTKGASHNLDVVVYDVQGKVNGASTFMFMADGSFFAPASINAKQGSFYGFMTIDPNTAGPNATPVQNGQPVTGSMLSLRGIQNSVERFSSGMYTELVWGGAARTVIVTNDAQGNPVARYWMFNADGTTGGPLGELQHVGSDRKLKDGIEDAAPDALGRVLRIARKEFSWKNNQRRDRGYIAQELAEIDPLYVFESDDYDGGKTLNVSQNALISDLIGAVQQLAAEVETLKSKG